MFAYIVRCNFSEPAKEQSWNDWYSGPKISQMLSKPFFRSNQRFHRSAGNGRNYLALWIIDSPQAFETPEYKSDWGFFEWKPYIIDWSRDLFSGSDIAAETFAVSPQGALRVVSFDGLGKDEATQAQKAFAASNPQMTWLTIAGLDRHTESIGLQPVRDSLPSWQPSNASAGAQDALYRPISDFHRSAGVRNTAAGAR